MARQQVACDDYVLGIFLDQIGRQADFGLMAAGDLVESAVPNGDSRRLWYSVQGLLGAVANVSKLIWPAYSTFHDDQYLSDRGERLQEVLHADSLTILRDKDLRNDFEHFDVRLEEWAVTVQGRPFSNLDTSRGVVTFRGKEYALKPVVDALVLARTRAMVAAEELRGPTNPQ